MKKILLSLLLAASTLASAHAQNTVQLPYAAQAVADIGNGPIKVRVIAGNASIFTSQGSGVGSTAGSSTSLTLTATPTTPPKIGAFISGTGITSGTTVTAYNGATSITLSAAMTVPASTTVSWGAACPASAAGIPTQYIQASVMADYYMLYTQARVCAVSPGGPVNTLLTLPVFLEAPQTSIIAPNHSILLGTGVSGFSSAGPCATGTVLAGVTGSDPVCDPNPLVTTIRASSGSAAAPPFNFVSGTTSGLYRDAGTGNVGVSVIGKSVMEFRTETTPTNWVEFSNSHANQNPIFTAKASADAQLGVSFQLYGHGTGGVDNPCLCVHSSVDGMAPAKISLYDTNQISLKRVELSAPTALVNSYTMYLPTQLGGVANRPLADTTGGGVLGFVPGLALSNLGFDSRGSAGTPIFGWGDSGYGFYSAGANQINIAAAGSPVFNITSGAVSVSNSTFALGTTIGISTGAATLCYNNGTGAVTYSLGGCVGGLKVGTSAVTNGTTTRILYDNAGVLGEYVISGTGNVAMTAGAALSNPTLSGLSTGVGTATVCVNTGTGALTSSAISGCAATAATNQKFLSGSGTYTTPTGAVRIRIRMIGGAGGGGGGGTTNTAAGAGGDTCWNTTGAACTTPVYDAGGGTAGGSNTGSSSGGGTVSGSGTCLVALTGQRGQAGSAVATFNYGGAGGNSAFFNGAAPMTVGGGNAGTAGSTNSGSGGSGGTSALATGTWGNGGAGGAGCEVTITSPAASYTYAVGAAGIAGVQTAGAGAQNGGAGSAGGIWVEEFYN